MTLTFYRNELIYDIANILYLCSDKWKETDDHGSHIIADATEDGNIDIINRYICLAASEARELLHRHTGQLAENKDTDDTKENPDSHTIEINLPESITEHSALMLTRLIHLYIVWRGVAEWLDIAMPEASQLWHAKALALTESIKSVTHTLTPLRRRRMHPF